MFNFFNRTPKIKVVFEGEFLIDGRWTFTRIEKTIKIDGITEENYNVIINRKVQECIDNDLPGHVGIEVVEHNGNDVVEKFLNQ